MGNQKAVRLLGKMSPYQTRRHRALGRHQGRNPFSAVRDVAVIPEGGHTLPRATAQEEKSSGPLPEPGGTLPGGGDKDPELGDGREQGQSSHGPGHERGVSGSGGAAGLRHTNHTVRAVMTNHLWAPESMATLGGQFQLKVCGIKRELAQHEERC